MTNHWRTIAHAPRALNEAQAVWTGTELLVVGAALDGSNRADTGTAVAMAYDPRTNAWEEPADPALSPQASTITALSDGSVLAWDYELRAASWTGSAWREEAELPLRSASAIRRAPACRTASSPGTAEAARSSRRSSRDWIALPPRTGFSAGPVAAGPVALFAGPGLWAYRPDA